MTLDPTYTAAWIALAVLAAWLEISALRRPDDLPRGELTWNIRKLFALGSRTKWAGRIIAAGLLAWLCVHFLYPKN
jgi:hypothetical protein